MMQVGRERLEANVSVRLGSGIKRVEQVLMAEKARALRDFDLTVPQYATLLALSYVPGQSAAQLARAALVSPQTMATILNNLEAKKLITRDVSSLHARVLVCELTDAGRELAAKADRVACAIEDDLRSAFTPAEFDRFREYLSRAEEHIRSRSA
ncbi:MAG: MarR family transcriptional regulator [Propionibacterium sp.]|jgi:transcriptional regulator, MarR family|nr:MarR family transcriptional regulator [Propionibacterium sp.]